MNKSILYEYRLQCNTPTRITLRIPCVDQFRTFFGESLNSHQFFNVKNDHEAPLYESVIRFSNWLEDFEGSDPAYVTSPRELYDIWYFVSVIFFHTYEERNSDACTVFKFFCCQMIFNGYKYNLDCCHHHYVRSLL